jgi:hypothetical protein
MADSDDRKLLDDFLEILPHKANTLKLRVGDLSAKFGYIADSVRVFS